MEEEYESKYEEFLYVEDFEAADKELLDRFKKPEDKVSFIGRPDGAEVSIRTKEELKSALKGVRGHLMRDKRDEDRVRSNRK